MLSMMVSNCFSRRGSPGYSPQKASIDVPMMTLRGGKFDVLCRRMSSPSNSKGDRARHDATVRTFLRKNP